MDKYDEFNDHRTDDEIFADGDEIIKRHVAALREHFDTVQIFVTKHSEEDQGTFNFSYGSGNNFAREGQIRGWINRVEQLHRNSAQEDDDDEE